VTTTSGHQTVKMYSRSKTPFKSEWRTMSLLYKIPTYLWIWSWKWRLFWNTPKHLLSFQHLFPLLKERHILNYIQRDQTKISKDILTAWSVGLKQKLKHNNTIEHRNHPIKTWTDVQTTSM